MKGVTMENEYAYIKDGKVFLKGYLDMADRQIGEVKRTEEEAFQYFVNRYDIAQSKVKQLEEEVAEAQNKGSYLTKLLQLRKRLLNFDGIGNFIPLLDKLSESEEYLRGLIVSNQSNNLSIKQDLIEETKYCIDNENWQDASDHLLDIKTRWIRTGPVDKPYQEDVEESFKLLLDDFYQRRKAFYDEQNRVNDERYAKYEELVQSSEQLIRRADWDEGFEDLKRLQQEWKAVGPIPPKRLKFLFKRFKRNTTLFYERYCAVKGIQIKVRVDPRIEAQTKLVEEAEELTKSKDMFVAAERAKVMLNDWKNIKVPMQVADRRLAERFRFACDKIFELSYLMKVIARKHPSFQYLSERQQLLTKLREMENIVYRAKGDLEQLIATNPRGSGANEEMNKMMDSNINTQKRKLAMKEHILDELKKQS